jgi:hypothetical protein
MADVGPTQASVEAELLAQAHDPHAHLRIDALQKVLSMVLADGVGRSAEDLMACFERGDTMVEQALSKVLISDCDTGEYREAPGGGKTQQTEAP